MSRKKGRKKKKSILTKIIILIITTILCVIGIGSIYLYQTLNKMNKSDDAKEVKKLTAQDTIEKNEGDPINFLVLGVDIGEAGSKVKDDSKRTDTMLLVNYNPKSEDVNVVSIPRDTLIKINGKNSKVNSANIIGGIPYAIDAVEKLLDVKIDYYGRINYEGFREVIDSIGGVDMEIAREMNYDDDKQDLHIHFKKGETVHLDGEKAEEFFRWRKNNNGTGLAEGDIGRIENQHLFMEKVMEKLKSPKIIPRIPGILMTIPKYCDTNMSADEIVKYGYDFITANNVKMQTLKGTGKYINKVSYFVYSEKANRELLDEIHGNTIFSEECDINKNDIKIEVLNCTKVNGLAAKYKKYLKEKGYNNISVGNGEEGKDTKILFAKFNKEQINCIKEDLDIETHEIINDKNTNFDIIILLGKNFTN